MPGLEEVWDAILSNGQLLYGIAVDDAHTFRIRETLMSRRRVARVVMVRSPRLGMASLLTALERGDFYATTGVELQQLEVSARRVRVDEDAAVFEARIQFIGKGGRVLAESITPTATYDITGDEGYVRARARKQRSHRLGPARHGGQQGLHASRFARMGAGRRGRGRSVGLLTATLGPSAQQLIVEYRRVE